jgi:hypothetical protein
MEAVYYAMNATSVHQMSLENAKFEDISHSGVQRLTINYIERVDANTTWVNPSRA